MKVIATCLGGTAAIVVLAVSWHGLPRDTAREPLASAASDVPHAASKREAVSSSSAPRPAVERDDGTTLIRNIERVLVSVDADERERVLEKDLPALVARDARSAGVLVERSEPGLVRDALRTRVARLWASQDLNGAMDWVSALGDSGERQLAAADVAAEVATSDPATALEVLDVFGVGRRDGTLEHVAQLWAEEHPEEALRYAQAQQPGPEKDQLLARIAVVQAARDPAAAASLAAHEITPGAAQRDAVAAVLRQWATQDPESAATWVSNLMDETLRKRSLAELARISQPGK